jgi:hypothetical protein
MVAKAKSLPKHHEVNSSACIGRAVRCRCCACLGLTKVRHLIADQLFQDVVQDLLRLHSFPYAQRRRRLGGRRFARHFGRRRVCSLAVRVRVSCSRRGCAAVEVLRDAQDVSRFFYEKAAWWWERGEGRGEKEARNE